MNKIRKERKMEFNYYTDGSSRGNPGPGGWGYILLQEGHLLEYSSGQEENTTNNRMELKAILEVAKLAAEHPKVGFIIHSDSAYCVNTINTWMWSWAKNNWKRSKNQPVENLDLIKQLYNLFDTEFFNACVRKVPGHSGLLGNELADRLAVDDKKGFNALIQSNLVELKKMGCIL